MPPNSKPEVGDKEPEAAVVLLKVVTGDVVADIVSVVGVLHSSLKSA